MTAIRTPDRRLRIFVSSTMKELASARAAARAAIERLRLTPVLFELGARPYPPRDLYLAYLRQSDVFVGIYWQQNGWIAPDQEISGSRMSTSMLVGCRSSSTFSLPPRTVIRGAPNAYAHPVRRIVLSRLQEQRRAEHTDRGRSGSAA